MEDTGDTGQPDNSPRNAFLEQMMTVRMPTAAPQRSPAPSQDASHAATQDGARYANPDARLFGIEAFEATEAIEAADTKRTGAASIEQVPTVRTAATHPPIASVAVASRPFAGMPEAAPSEYTPAHSPPVARGRRGRAPRQPQSRERRRMAVAAFTVILFVMALIPVLSYVSATQSSRVSHNAGFAQGANPPAGWHPQNWAPLARQQAEVRYVNQLIGRMTLDEEIGQMIMLGFLETQMSPSLAYTIKQYHLGSVVLYAWNITGADQVKQLTAQIQAEGDLPLLIATDQEGGSVNRLQAVDGPLPSAAAIGASGDPNFARQRGAQDAQQLSELGINVNFAPAVDVANTSGGDLGGRTFGSTPDQVTTMAGAYLAGLQSSGQVVGTLKHFPGLGDVPADPHTTLYTLDRSQADLERIDWAPYRALIGSGAAQMIMSTHVVLSAIDATRPASLSKPVLTGILRDQLGFQGVIVTDGIYMGALTASYSFDQIIVDAVEAGNDIICSTYSIASTAEAVHALENAVQSGQISKSRIDDSVRRILLLKLRYGVLTLPQGQH